MAQRPTTQEMIGAGVHFGHLTYKWSPKMHEYIFMESNGIHLIDLRKTAEALERAEFALKNIVKSGRKVLFVATKKQAKQIIEQQAKSLEMPYVTERWLGGMLTNFATVRRSLRKLSNIESQMKNEDFNNIAKRERLTIARDKKKLEKLLGGISDLRRLPAALLVVDVKREHIAVAEARKLNIPVIAMVDTNSSPADVDYPIPSNDDASKSVSLIVGYLSDVIREGLAERKKKREDEVIEREEGEFESVAKNVEQDEDVET